MGLYSALRDPSHAALFADAADVMGHIRPLATNILAELAARLVKDLLEADLLDAGEVTAARQVVLDRFAVSSAAMHTSALFDEQLCRQALSKAQKGAAANAKEVEALHAAAARAATCSRHKTKTVSANRPTALQEAAEAVFSSEEMRGAQPQHCKIWLFDLLVGTSKEMETSISNLLTIGNKELLRKYLRRAYDLTGPEAKKLAQRLCIAKSERREAAVNFLAGRAKGDCHRAIALVNKAEKHKRATLAHAAGVAARVGHSAAAATDAQRRIHDATLDVATATESLRIAEAALASWATPEKQATALALFDAAEFGERRQRRRTRDASEEEEPAPAVALRPLREIFDAELRLVPETLGQVVQLEFRGRMICALKEAGITIFSELMPKAGSGRPFIHVPAPIVQKLLGKKVSATRTGDGSMQALLPRLLTDDTLKQLHPWAGVGATFGTDGTQIHIKVVNEPQWRASSAKTRRQQQASARWHRGTPQPLRPLRTPLLRPPPTPPLPATTTARLRC